MNMTPSAACATCEICLPLLSTNLRRTILNWRADIEAKTLGLWRRQSFGSSTLLRVAMTVSLQLTQLVSGILICFQRARARAETGHVAGRCLRKATAIVVVADDIIKSTGSDLRWTLLGTLLPPLEGSPLDG